MKTTSLLRAAVLGGGVALLANPVWAGGGAHSYDKNQAGQQRMHDSGTQISNLEKEKKKDIEQALQDKGFEPGSVDGVIDTQTQSAISQFQRDNNLPATARWTSKRQSGLAYKSCLQQDQNGNLKDRAARRAVSAPRAARRRLAELNKF
jgi:peptidoglycan hydrolase-like protein with peptidoglycan-binding domain